MSQTNGKTTLCYMCGSIGYEEETDYSGFWSYDDPKDDEAIIGEVTSVSGRYAIVLQQGGAVSISEDGRRFATELVCDVAEHLRERDEHHRRRLQQGPWSGMACDMAGTNSSGGEW